MKQAKFLRKLGIKRVKKTARGGRGKFDWLHGKHQHQGGELAEKTGEA
jgi:hypothetical protein